MWALRVLTGPQQGTIVVLKSGKNIVGRSANCTLQVHAAGVSKEHAEIHVQSEKIFIVDLHSANGTYINGVKIQNGILKVGDKVGIHDILLDVIAVPASTAKQIQSVGQALPGANIPMSKSSATGNSPALNTNKKDTVMPYGTGVGGSLGDSTANANSRVTAEAARPEPGAAKKFQEYIEYVLLPGVYKLAEYTELKVVIGLFLAGFCFIVTFLSIIPMTKLNRETVTVEGERRAMSMAKSLAQINQTALLSNAISSLSTNNYEVEDGVKEVLIIQQSDGMILAPASRSGTTPDLPFVHQARREMKAQVGQIDSTIVAASFPIGAFDPNTGDVIVKAHAIIFYDIQALTYDDGRVISLFMQNLLISLIVGSIFFFFIYKLFEYPFRRLNEELDEAMRGSHDNIQIDFQLTELQNLISNVNSLLGRSNHSGEMYQTSSVNHDMDFQLLTEINALTPMAVINAAGLFIAMNDRFAHMCHADELVGLHFSGINDGSLRQNIEFLINKSNEVPTSIHTDQLEFSGNACHLQCSAFLSGEGIPEYFFISIIPVEGMAA